MKIILNQVFDYLKKVGSPINGNAEAKLFIALTAFLLYVLPIGLLDFFTKLVPTEFVFYTIVSLIVACLGLGAITQWRSNTIKGDVASDVLSEKPTKEVIQGAKEVLKNEEGA